MAGSRRSVFLKTRCGENTKAATCGRRYCRTPFSLRWATDPIASINERSDCLRASRTKRTQDPGHRRHGRYGILPTGHLVYGYGGGLLAARFDPVPGKLLGSALPVVEGVQMSASNGSTRSDVSQTGTLAYVPAECRKAVPDRDGRSRWQRGKALRRESGSRGDAALPGWPAARPPNLQGRTTIFTSWIWPVAPRHGSPSRAAMSRLPCGHRTVPRRLQFGARHARVDHWKAADGSGTPHLLSKAEHPRQPSAISPDGKFLLFTEEHPATRSDLWLMRAARMGAAAEPRPWIQTAVRRDNAVVLTRRTLGRLAHRTSPGKRRSSWLGFRTAA